MWKIILISVVAIATVATIVKVTQNKRDASSDMEKNENLVFGSRMTQMLDMGNARTLAQYEEDGFTLDVNGGAVAFKVASNPTTGYTWIIDERPGVGACSADIVRISQEFDPPAQYEGEEELAGVGGDEYFTFNAINGGECDFRMAYARGWMFNWDDETTYVNAEQIIEIPVSVV